MSAPISGDALAQALAPILPQAYLVLVGTAMIVYEYLITFGQEITLFWRLKLTGATVLFLMVRYLALLSYALSAATYAPMSAKTCTKVVTAQAIINISQYVVWAATSSLRVLVLSKMNWTLATVVFVLALGPFVVNAWDIALGLTGVILPVFGCAAGSNLTVFATIGSRLPVTIADSLVIIVTWRSGIVGLGLATGWSLSSLGSVLIINGTTYFLVIVTLNILHLIFTLLSITEVLEPVSPLILLVDPLVAILTCRFLLALQSANQKALGQHHSGTLSTGDGDDNGSTLQFASRVLGSIGASLPGESVASVLGGQEIDLEGGLEMEEKVAEADQGETGQAPLDVHSDIQIVSY